MLKNLVNTSASLASSVHWKDEHLQRHVFLEGDGEHEIHPFSARSRLGVPLQDADELDLAEAALGR